MYDQFCTQFQTICSLSFDVFGISTFIQILTRLKKSQTHILLTYLFLLFDKTRAIFIYLRSIDNQFTTVGTEAAVRYERNQRDRVTGQPVSYNQQSSISLQKLIILMVGYATHQLRSQNGIYTYSIPVNHVLFLVGADDEYKSIIAGVVPALVILILIAVGVIIWLKYFHRKRIHFMQREFEDAMASGSPGTLRNTYDYQHP